MANPEHLEKLKEGVEVWNQWRKQDPILPDLCEAELAGAGLGGANLDRTNLAGATLIEADLGYANLSQANLSQANLSQTNLTGAKLNFADLHFADLRGANLSGAFLGHANLGHSTLGQTNLSGANLMFVDFSEADLRGACLIKAKLLWADLTEANLTGADLTGADLSGATLVSTNLNKANLTACSVFGISAWKVKLEGAIQSNLVITPFDESPIQVDNLEVAQFIYLLLNNDRIRGVIETITSKVVLILGRFTPERKAVLDAIRDELRKRGYLPVLFDFEKPASKDLTGTIFTLANMARFIIADLTDPSSVPYELGRLVPNTKVPVQTIILEGQREFAMFADLKSSFHWVLEPQQYKSQELLIAQLGETVIAPAEAKAKELVRN